ncbi:MAG: YitT family protein [Clostridia bacterium]|nr:YitT family protein [Clostridia bacterium]
MGETAFKNTLSVIATALIALVVSLGMHVFVYPSGFAPSGFDGLATMLQSMSGVSAGVFVFLLNVPLLTAAWFLLRRRYVILTVFYTVFLSFFIALWARVGLYQYDAEGERLLAAVFGGISQGCTGFMLRMGASSGGVDIVGSMIQQKMPHRDVEKIISMVSAVIVGVSFLVYRNFSSVLLSVVEIFVCERVTSLILHSTRSAVKFELITDNAEALKHDILEELHHGATVFEAKGLYSGEKKQVVFCVVNYRQIPDFFKIVEKHERVFVYYTSALRIRGNYDFK